MKNLFNVLVILCLAGCASLVPTNKTTESAANAQNAFNTSQADKLKQVITGRMTPAPVIPPANKPMSVTVSGKDNTVAVMPEAAPVQDPSPAGLNLGGLNLSQYALKPMRDGTFRIVQVQQPSETIEYESNAGQRATSDEAQSMFSKVQIPLWVGLIGTVIGLGMLTALIMFWKKSSAGAAAALSLADNGLAKFAAVAEAKLAAATDPKEQADAAQQLAEVNKQRGLLARQMTPKKP